MQIKTDGRWFKDEHGRTLHLRGVNLGGSSKVPRIPDGATWNRQGFFNHREVSFVGRPFPLEEADEHFSRLNKWGLTFLRFLVTWEAIEHAGPGIYDEAYLDYIHAVVQKAAEHDLQIFIDPHQDVWSRFSGGDGAPGWTFESVGMDITRLTATGAAFTHQEHGDPYPRMMWPSNYSKFACATMFTLFFAGNNFAPQLKVDGIPVQEFLQSHYCNAIKQVALRLKGLPNVVGYDTLNEPSQGYIGYPDANLIPTRMTARGPSPTIYQGMLLAAGIPQQVVKYQLLSILLGKARSVWLNQDGLSLWLHRYDPIWKANGVWDLDRDGHPHLLQPDYFSSVDGQEVNFGRDYYAPFVRRYQDAIRDVHPDALIFVSPLPQETSYGRFTPQFPDRQGYVYSPHFYDGLTLHLQRYVPWLGVDTKDHKVSFIMGHRRVRKNFSDQIGRLLLTAQQDFGGVPTLIGETGVPMNMHAKAAYSTGDFSRQVMAMDDTIQALEANLADFTLWNYTADNTNARGDQWNDEDLSIFSRDQQIGSGDLNDGGRALQAVVRPYALKTPGEPLRMSYDLKSQVFEFEFRLAPKVDMPAELFVPEYAYPGGYQVEAPAGRYKTELETQRLFYYPDLEYSTHKIIITP
jgi:hypothetical protein